MITVRFVLEGSSEFTAPMPELPRMGETVMVDISVINATGQRGAGQGSQHNGVLSILG